MTTGRGGSAGHNAVAKIRVRATWGQNTGTVQAQGINESEP